MEKKLNDIVQLLNNYRNSQHIPGLAVSIIKDKKTLYTQGFGTPDIAQPYQLVKPDTLFSVQGITQSFTATCLAHLESHTTFRLNDPIQKFLPDFKGGITTKDLLSHSSGYTKPHSLASLCDDRLVNFIKNMPEYKQMIQAAPNREQLETTLTSREQITDYLSDETVDEKPGKQFYFWSDGYIIAAHVLELVSGISWENYVMKYIVNPLGLKDTSINLPKEIEQMKTAKYYMKGIGTPVEVPRPYNIIGAPASSIYSTVADLSKYIIAQMTGGEIVSEISLREMQTTKIKIDDTSSYGLGWKLIDNLGMKVVEQTGNSPGTSSAILFVPERQLGLVLLCNTDMIKLDKLGHRMIRRWFSEEQ